MYVCMYVCMYVWGYVHTSDNQSILTFTYIINGTKTAAECLLIFLVFYQISIAKKIKIKYNTLNRKILYFFKYKKEYFYYQ
jgi:hypothetical protein